MLDVRRRFGLLVLMLLCAAHLAQATDLQSESDISRDQDPDQVRSRLQAQHSQAQDYYQKQESACYGLFLVTDCIRQVRAERRKVLEALRRDERALNDAERKRKAQAQVQEIQDRSSIQRLEGAAERRLDVNQAHEQQAQPVNQKDGSSLSPESSQSPVIYRAREPGQTPDALAKNQKQYLEKLKDAKERRENRFKGMAEKIGAPIKSLPVPP